MNPEEDHALIYDEIEKKQMELNDLLLELSDVYGEGSEERVRDIGKEICAIYKSGISGGYQFRHQYHYFIEVLKSVPSKDLIDVLLDNLKMIIEDNKSDEIALPNLLKLYDHISIDIARMSIESEAHNAVMNLNESSKEMEKLRIDVKGLGIKAKEAHRKVESIQIEIVAILGVFSAIVIGFTGGLDIIGGALSNVGMKDFPLILFSISLCGMVIFDMLWLLMECVMRIVKDRKESVIEKEPIIAFNIMMMILMATAYFLS